MSVGHVKSAPAGAHGEMDASYRVLENAIVVPSGDQDGQPSFAPRVRRTASLPSAFATKMPRSSTTGSWYAIRVPSGDHATCTIRIGSPSNTTRRSEPSGDTEYHVDPPSPPTRYRICPFATPVAGDPGTPDFLDPPNVIAAAPIPTAATMKATAIASTRRRAGGAGDGRGSRCSISRQRSGVLVRENERNRSSRSTIVVLQALAEATPATHHVHANRSLG